LKSSSKMTAHYFENEFIRLHYYRFGKGAKHMLCFHGFGMHGKQFGCLESTLGDQYTFWGFDLFFHKETTLKDQSLATVKKGLDKKVLAKLVQDFCSHECIEKFSVIGYSMGSHYATAITELLPERIIEYIVAAPSSLNPGMLVRYFGKSSTGNKLLEKLMLSERAVYHLIRFFKWLRLIDAAGRDILYKEIGTPQLRFALYACFTYLRYLETDEVELIKALSNHPIKSIFIFGKNDKMYLPKIGAAFFHKMAVANVLVSPKIIILEENHEMINTNFANRLADLLL
jgi:pimeloyl-ACP methyl ester carboxylesterase